VIRVAKPALVIVLVASGCKANGLLPDAGVPDAGTAAAGACVTPLFTARFPATVAPIERHVSTRSASCVGLTSREGFFAAVSVPTSFGEVWLDLFESALREEEMRLGTPVVARRDRLLDGAVGVLLEAEAGARLRLAVAQADGRLYVLYAGFSDLGPEAAQEAAAFIDSFRRIRVTASAAPAPAPAARAIASPCQLDEPAVEECERDRISPSLCAGAANLDALTVGFCRHLALILTQAECRRGVCGIGQLCSGGICCPLGSSRCGSICFDPQKCQSCDQATGIVLQGCADRSRCEVCEPGRVPGENGVCKGCNRPHGDDCCAGQCTAVYTDENCGACGNVCRNGFSCDGSECVCGTARTCPPGMRCIDSRCQ
jgi:hypothetical protein